MLRERLADLRAALADAGRDPATLATTAGIGVAFAGADDDDAEGSMQGSTAEIADGLAGYAELGISHLIAHVFPPNPDSVARFGEAAAVARERLAG